MQDSAVGMVEGHLLRQAWQALQLLQAYVLLECAYLVSIEQTFQKRGGG